MWLTLQIHGTVNAIHTSLSVGASLETMHKFDGPGVRSRWSTELNLQIWARWSDSSKPQLTVFHAVPTIYSRMEGLHAKMSPEEQQRASAGARAFRLQVSGSAALPTPLCVELLIAPADSAASKDGAISAVTSCSSASG